MGFDNVTANVCSNSVGLVETSGLVHPNFIFTSTFEVTVSFCDQDIPLSRLLRSAVTFPA